ncbi:hypothetical protein [Clostridium sp.]
MTKKITELYNKVEQNLEYYFYKNPNILESIVGFKIIKSDLERTVMGRRVDIVNGTFENTVVLTEVSARCNTQNDYNCHLRQIVKIIDIVGKIKYADIILIAPNFRDDDIREIKMLISNSNLSVKLIWLPPPYVFIVQDYVLEGKNMKQIADTLKDVKHKWQWVTLNSNVRDITIPFVIPIDKEAMGIKIMKDILLRLRERMDYNFAVLKYKSFIGNRLTIGTGTADIILNIYIKKNKGKEDIIKIQLDFAKRENVCLKFMSNIRKMGIFIGYPVEVIGDRLEIISVVKVSDNDKITVNLVVNIIEKYLLYTHEMYKNMKA